MRAFHKSCRSSDLSVMVIMKRGRRIEQDICNHCGKMVERHEIMQSFRPLPTLITLIANKSHNDKMESFVQHSILKVAR